jgi:hypothetical protein
MSEKHFHAVSHGKFNVDINNPLTDTELHNVQVKLARQQRHVELQWAQYFRRHNQPDAVKRSVLLALSWHKLLHELLNVAPRDEIPEWQTRAEIEAEWARDEQATRESVRP